jgi:ATP-binding cassette subfamily C protein
VSVPDSTDRVLLPTASGAETRRVLRELLRPQRTPLLAAIACLVGGTVAGLAAPPVLGRIVDLVVDGRPAGALTGPAVLLAALAVLQGVLIAAGTALVARTGEPALADLRERVLARALSLPLGAVERAGSGDLLARVSDDVAETATAVRNALPALAVAGLTVALTLVGLAALDVRFALAGLCAAPIQLLALRWYLRRAGPLYAAERVAGSGRAQGLLDAIGGARTVRALGLGDEHVARIDRRSADALALSVRTVHVQTGFFSRLNAAELVGTGAILLVGFGLVRDGAVSVGEASAAALYFLRLFDPLGALLGLVDDAQSAGASLARLVGVAGIEEPAGPDGAARADQGSERGPGTDDRGPRSGPAASAGVSVSGVRFGYGPGHEVLHGVDLELAPGEHVALVGVSGAGKTTLAKLVAGVHEPSAGTIALGGVPLAELGPAGVRRRIALVTQEVHVFSGTLRDDLRLARPGATDDELDVALERVGASAWARALPDGLGTVVGDGGHRIGAAQAQALALARLVLADPPVAVLDEATAEAGSAGARALDAAAGRSLRGRTALIVAHRLVQARRADRIVVLDAGRILEQGTHDDLVAAGGAYARMWAAWTSTRTAGA